MSGEIEPRNLLVSDAEREHVGQLLQRAVGQGRITLEEFETRMTAAMAARTRGDLNALVLDIAQAYVMPAVRAKEVLELRGGIGDIKRRGHWVVPPTVKVTGGVGSVVLDFTQALFSSPETTLDVKLGVGDLLLILPPGSSVDYDELHTSVGEIKDRTRHEPVEGGQRFVVRGSTTMGSVKIAHPYSRRFGPWRVHRYPFRITWGARAAG